MDGDTVRLGHRRGASPDITIEEGTTMFGWIVSLAVSILYLAFVWWIIWGALPRDVEEDDEEEE
jgi:hypothetical protein